MKLKRIFSVILLSMLLLPVLTLPAMAFPFEEFTTDDGTLKVRELYNYDTDYEDFVAERNLMFSRRLSFIGYEKGTGNELYKQDALLTIALPGGYFDHAEQSFKTDPEKINSFQGYESFLWYNQYVVNKVHCHLNYSINKVTLIASSRTQSAAEKVEEEMDFYRNLEEESNTYVDDPKTIRKEADGYSVILHEMTPTIFHMGEGTLEERYKVFKSEMHTWRYIRFMMVPGLPDVYVKVAFFEEYSITVKIEEPDNRNPDDDYKDGNWEPYYEEALKRFNKYQTMTVGEEILNLPSLVSVTWEEPVISPLYGGSETSAGTTEGTSQVTEAAGSETETSGKQIIDVWHKQDASTSSGEDDGVSVLTAIVAGLTGVAAAIGGAAAAIGATGAAGAAGASDLPGGEDAPRSTYKMYVDKDFGDALRRGGRPASVRARMAEITPEGAEIDRNDLTALISASASGMTLHYAATSGRYCEASVSIPDGYAGETADLSFIFTGEGGTFTNTVTFRVVDHPYVAFPSDDEPEGADFLEHKDTLWMKGILGDGLTYHARFMVADAAEAPALSDLSAASEDGLTAEFEPTENPFVFRVSVKNGTKLSGNSSLFADPSLAFLTVTVRMKEAEPISGSIRMELYPEGLSVRSQNLARKNDLQYVDVQAFQQKDPQGLDGRWRVSTMELTLAVRDGDRVVVNPADAAYTFAKLEGAGGVGTSESAERSVASKYEYREETQYRDGMFVYTFEPNATLIDPEDGSFFVVKLPVSCRFGESTYTADVPMRLRGEFVDPYAGWDEEYQALKACIEKFSLPEEKVRWETRLEELVRDPMCSTKQLRLTRKSIIRSYMQYWMIESIANVNDAKIYDNIVSDLEWIKFFGDCAFSFLVSMYAGPVAEAIISPAKDYFAESAGELIACWRQGTEVRLENFSVAKSVEAAGDNLMSNQITLTSWRKAAATLGAYFVYAAIKNYLAKVRDEGESDLYGSLVKAFSDMTAQGLKAAASALFGKWVMKNKTAREWIGKNITKHFNDHLGRGRFFNLKDQVIKQPNLAYQLNDALGLEGKLRALAGFEGEAKKMKVLKLDIVEKYLMEFIGKGLGTVKEKTDEFYDNSRNYDMSFHVEDGGHMVVSLTVEAFENDVYEINIDLTRALLNTASGLFGLLYDMIFGSVPTFRHTIKEPEDPPLPPPGV